ncbi:MAG: enoyl-CoA hydratase-related protein [Acidimicrobiales bacterium]
MATGPTPDPATEISYEVIGSAGVLTLRRPETLNALTLPMLASVERTVRRAVADPEVTAVIITGDGRGFCSGLDASALAAFAETGSAGRGGGDTGDGADHPAPGEDHLHGLFSYLIQQPKPIIAAINGVAAGGGFVLAAKCDLRFASTAASFTTVFSKRGLIAEHGTTWLMPRMVGVGDALDLLWSSRRIDATEAHRIGLVQRVVPADELVSDAVAYVDDLTANVSPASLADTKRLTYRHLGLDHTTAFEEADVAGWAAMDRPDAREGVASLIERRPPAFERLGSPERPGPTERSEGSTTS